MEIVFRTDATPRIGYGHLSRSLTLADELERRGFGSVFVIRHASRPTAGRIEARGHRVEVLAAPFDADEGPSSDKWLDVFWSADARRTCEAVDVDTVEAVVVDQYGLAEQWEQWVGEATGAPVAVVDGIADRRHRCELLVDPTLTVGPARRRWADLVYPGTRVIAGSQYVMLRPEFGREESASRHRDGSIRELLVAFGGSDIEGATELTLDGLTGLESPPKTIVVAGPAKPDVDRLSRRCEELDFVEFHFDTDQMARLMGRADLAVGGAGTMMWERAAMGLPAVVVAISHHQVGVARPVAESGAIEYLGRREVVDASMIREAVQRARNRPDRVRTMVEANRRLMGGDGRSGTEKVADAVVEMIESPNNFDG